jgi:hypothetical protein
VHRDHLVSKEQHQIEVKSDLLVRNETNTFVFRSLSLNWIYILPFSNKSMNIYILKVLAGFYDSSLNSIILAILANFIVKVTTLRYNNFVVAVVVVDCCFGFIGFSLLFFR